MAAFTLFDLAYRVARELGIIIETTATAGAVGSITDNVWLIDRYPDDFFNGGTAFVIYDAGGAAAAPQGEWARISDFVKTTGVVSLATNLTAAVAANDRVAICTAEYPRDQIISQINQVLAEIPAEFHDDTTITTAESQTEYTLPAAVLDQNIEVWINTNDTTNENYWVKTDDWYIEEEITGTQKKLIFNVQPISAYHVRIKYWTPHTPLYASTDKLRESININRVVLPAAYRCLVWKRAQKSESDALLDARIALAYQNAENSRWKYKTVNNYIKLNTLGYTDDQGSIN